MFQGSGEDMRSRFALEGKAIALYAGTFEAYQGPSICCSRHLSQSPGNLAACAPAHGRRHGSGTRA